MSSKIGDITRTHGLSGHPMYGTWRTMVRRCYDSGREEYKYYGAKGVTVCDEWRHTPRMFIKWGMDNGWEPGMEIDKDIKGGNVYSPENCVIVSHKENANRMSSNHLIEYIGQVKNIQQWAEHFKMNHKAIRTRIRRGWSIDKVFSVPINPARYGAGKQ